MELCQNMYICVCVNIYIYFNNTREDSTHGNHQVVNTEIILIVFFAAKNEEAL